MTEREPQEKGGKDNTHQSTENKMVLKAIQRADKQTGSNEVFKTTTRISSTGLRRKKVSVGCMPKDGADVRALDRIRNMLFSSARGSRLGGA